MKYLITYAYHNDENRTTFHYDITENIPAWVKAMVKQYGCNYHLVNSQEVDQDTAQALLDHGIYEKL